MSATCQCDETGDNPKCFAHGDGSQWALRQQVNDLLRERDALESSLRESTAAKNGAYSERNKLVAALSKIFPASLERHPDEDLSWEDDWRWIVFIDLPTGQASWHLHDSEIDQFGHVQRNAGRKWDGHTTEKKYERLAALSPAPAAKEDAH